MTDSKFPDKGEIEELDEIEEEELEEELDEVEEPEDEEYEFPLATFGGPLNSPMGGGGGYAPLGNGGSGMADTKAYSSYQVYLMKKSGSTWAKLVDIRDFPDLQGDPNMLDTTTLSDKKETQTPGIKRSGEKKFTALYSKTDYALLKGLQDAGDVLDVSVWFGGTTAGVPDGTNGKFDGQALLSVKVLGKGVDEVLEMEITLAMQSAFKKV